MFRKILGAVLALLSLCCLLDARAANHVVVIDSANLDALAQWQSDPSEARSAHHHALVVHDEIVLYASDWQLSNTALAAPPNTSRGLIANNPASALEKALSLLDSAPNSDQPARIIFIQPRDFELEDAEKRANFEQWFARLLLPQAQRSGVQVLWSGERLPDSALWRSLAEQNLLRAVADPSGASDTTETSPPLPTVSQPKLGATLQTPLDPPAVADPPPEVQAPQNTGTSPAGITTLASRYGAAVAAVAAALLGLVILVVFRRREARQRRQLLESRRDPHLNPSPQTADAATVQSTQHDVDTMISVRPAQPTGIRPTSAETSTQQTGVRPLKPGTTL